jgi:hypothetical protein
LGRGRESGPQRQGWAGSVKEEREKKIRGREEEEWAGGGPNWAGSEI